MENTETAKEKTKAAPVVVDHGQIVPKNSEELGGVLEIIAKGGGFPECFDTREKRIAAYNLANALMGSRWQLAINHMAPIKGKLSIYGELPGAIAEATGEVETKKVFVIDEHLNRICIENKNLDAKPYAGICQIKRKGRELEEFTYTLKQAENAGQYPAKRRDGSINLDSPWMKFTGVMLMRKAMALALKMIFPDALLGVPIAEYDYDEAPDLVDVSSSGERTVTAIADEVNRRFSDGA